MFIGKKRKEKKAENQVSEEVKQEAAVIETDAEKAADASTEENSVAENANKTAAEETAQETAGETSDAKETQELTRPFRVTIESKLPNQKEVHTEVFECERVTLISESVEGAVRSDANSDDFQETRTGSVYCGGVKDVSEAMRLLMCGVVGELRRISGEDEVHRLHANAIQFAQMILGSCNVPNEHVHITVDDWYVQENRAFREREDARREQKNQKTAGLGV